jgi:protein ImuA
LLPGLNRAALGPMVLVGAPHVPFRPGLAGQGLNPQRLLCINTVTPASRLWASEQALRCKEVVAVLAWLPQVRADQLRRLQIAAAEHAKLLFVMRPVQAQSESSPAVLRLLLSLQADSDALELRILKRRGPPLEQPLVLPARPARLSALLAVGQERGMGQAAGSAAPPVDRAVEALVVPAVVTTAGSSVIAIHTFKRQDHALDRIAAAA